MSVSVAPPELEEKSPFRSISIGRVTLYASGVLGLALALAGVIFLIQAGRDPERAVLLTGVFLGALLAAAPVVYLVRSGRLAQPATAGLVFLAATTTLLLAIYFYWVSWYVLFPADFLIWTEGDFVNDILKISSGYPIYTPQVNNDSFFYVPGTQWLTFLLARLVGMGSSIAAFRVIQLIYTAAAALVATLCCRQILRMAWPNLRAANSWLWNAFWYGGAFLIATNSITSPFVHNLHGDALAQLAGLIGYYLLLRYCETRSLSALAGMAVFAPVGFLIRQSLLMWGGFFAGFLAGWDRRWKRVAGFAIAVGAMAGIALGVCYAVWREPFVYWTIYVLGKHGVSPLRSFQHVLTAWPYFAAGLLGGAAILRKGALTGPPARALQGAWLVWLAIIAAETYTSGIAWMLNHIGPGSLIGGVWFLAGMASVWEYASATWINSAALTATVALFFSGLGIVRIPVKSVPDDAYRYVHDIEREFQGLPARNVLVDAGSWVYMKSGVIMGDRAPSIGERGFRATGDFSGILNRIAQKRYAKILVRGFHDTDFVYDYYMWPKPSGIRQALLDNYRETGSIPAVADYPYLKNWAEDPYYFGKISILEPKTDSQGK
jgi:hypothetical protein